MLLDTNILIWLFTDRSKIGKTTLRTLERADTLAVHVASLHEVAIKQRLGKLGNLFDELIIQIKEQRITRLAVTDAQLQAYILLNQEPHRDPFDLLIVATAIQLQLPLVTSDKRLLVMKYDNLKVIDARK
ncbi:MAG: type II toxin-antitoxin system VapC family toxin [Candidatus Saccharimonadales bacterium]